MSLLIHLPRFKRAKASLHQLAERESWPRDRIERWQLDQLNRVWSSAREHVPYYQQLAADHRLPSSFDSLQDYSDRMPLLEKSVVRDSPESILSRSPASGSWHRTGGSTGTPMRVYWEKATHLQMLRAKYRMLQNWDIDIFDRSTFLWGHSGSIAPGLAGFKQRMRRPIEDHVRRRLRLSAYRLGPSDLDEHLARMRRFAPLSLYGYSSAVTLLAEHAAAREIRIPSLRVAILTAEPADPESIEKTSRGLGCDAAIEYGSVECGVIATTHRDGSLRVREDHVLLETIESDEGGYELVVTVLNNPSFPLLRYRIDDMTSRPINRPDVGFSAIDQVAGRRNDFLLSKKGSTVHSMAVKHVLEHYDMIRRFRAHQNTDGELDVMLESFHGSDLPVAMLEEKLSALLDGYPARIQITDSIAGNLAGKHRWIISDLVAKKQLSPEQIAPASAG